MGYYEDIRCEDCGTILSYGVCGNCHEVEANDMIMAQPEWQPQHEEYPDWTTD